MDPKVAESIDQVPDKLIRVRDALRCCSNSVSKAGAVLSESFTGALAAYSQAVDLGGDLIGVEEVQEFVIPAWKLNPSIPANFRVARGEIGNEWVPPNIDLGPGQSLSGLLVDRNVFSLLQRNVEAQVHVKAALQYADMAFKAVLQRTENQGGMNCARCMVEKVLEAHRRKWIRPPQRIRVRV